MRFRNRAEAGRLLATKLAAYSHRQGVLVLALPRGGVPVALEVSEALQAPMDIFLVRKLGVPGHEELAMGAIATGGIRLLNQDVVHYFAISRATIDAVAAKEQKELERRARLYRNGRAPMNITDQIVILVDDGLATGSSMRAAVAAVREQKPARIVVAVPVAAISTCEELRAESDETVCLETPEPFQAVGLWYDDFSQTSDEEVRVLLERAESAHSTAGP